MWATLGSCQSLLVIREKAEMAERTTLRWRKSRRSQWGGDCVEVADAGAVVYIRDSKNAKGPMLVVAIEQWTAFLSMVKNRG